MVDIFPQTVSYPSPSQYIQSVINANAAGTTYVLKSGVHRMQTIRPKTGDIITFEAGTILRGSEDISGWTWTKDGAANRWYTSLISAGSVLGSAGLRDLASGYSPPYQGYEFNPVLDGEPMAYRASTSTVDAWTAYYDSAADRLYIGRDPNSLTSMELCRTSLSFEGSTTSIKNVTIQGNRYSPGIIENYASGVQSENAAVKVGRSGSSTIPTANWLMQDIIVRNMRGMALAHGDDCTIRRVDVYNSGQLGVGGSFSEGGIFEYCAVYRNGIGDWRSGWEAGNTKWARVWSHINRGSWYDSIAFGEDSSDAHPHLQMTGPLWYDIANDAVDIYDCHLLDRGHLGGRGLFWEISWSLKFYSNRLYELAWDIEDPAWAESILFSTSGAVPGQSAYPACIVEDNVSYNCSGFMKLQNTTRGAPTSGPLTGVPYRTSYITTRRNSFSIKVGVGPNSLGQNGTDGSKNGTTPFGEGIIFEGNQYMVDSLSTNRWRVDVDSEEPGLTGAMDWAEWLSRGDYDNPDGHAIVHQQGVPRATNNPYTGGAM